ncbi:MAG: ATP-binding protein [Legionellaceae bacterium]|nr:ATP-binding protein [Legionellaceae bacterium]
MTLTKQAKKMFYKLSAGNFVILITGVSLALYYIVTMKTFSVHPDVAVNLATLTARLQSQPESQWPSLLEKRHPHILLSISNHPKYPKHKFATLLPSYLIEETSRHQSISLSVQIQQHQWLNININSPKFNKTLFVLIPFILGFSLIIVLILWNYWVVNQLNNSFRMLIEHLNYAKKQDTWQPIPLVGDEEQQLIFQYLNELQEKTNQILDNRTYVLAAISHDLRTPLTRLKLRTEYLQQHDLYHKIVQDISDMEMMIHETLDYFKELNHDETKLRFDLVGMLNAICDDAVDMGLRIQFVSDIEKLPYVGCINLLKRAFNNVIQNALHYGDMVSVSLHSDHKEINITIEDNGQGIDDQTLKHVFKPFYRHEHSRSRETGGTGLGLTITQEILQKHHASIKLNNRVEGGLRVIITLPKHIF